jgi:hypothetical protein
MEYNKFKKAIYNLAKFNSTLTKGYGKEWTDRDYIGYKHKNKQLKRLCEIAIKNNYEVYNSFGIIYFIFGNIQISFHLNSGYVLNEDFDFVPKKNIEWDRIKNAHSYTEKEYIKLKQIVEVEINNRIKYKNTHYTIFVDMIKKHLDILNVKYSKSKSEKNKLKLMEDINVINLFLNKFKKNNSFLHSINDVYYKTATRFGYTRYLVTPFNFNLPIVSEIYIYYEANIRKTTLDSFITTYSI